MSRKSKSKSNPDEEALFMELLREKVESGKVKPKKTKIIEVSDSDDSDNELAQMKQQLISKAKAPKSTKQVDHLAKAREKKKLLAEEKKKQTKETIKSQVKTQMNKKLQTGTARTKVVTPKIKTIEADESELEKEYEKREQQEEKERLMQMYHEKYANVFG